jgi:hypothetical protein
MSFMASVVPVEFAADFVERGHLVLMGLVQKELQ